MRRGAPLVAMGAGMYAGRKMAQAGAAQQEAAAQQAQMNQQLAQQPAGAAAPAPAAASPAPAAGPAAGGDDTVAQLTKLAQLREAGVLSPEEFEQAKAKVLA
ncbi:MAG TPA: SHOCT domain-containing protein [Candidatus Dormibacteraeota bacterium]